VAKGAHSAQACRWITPAANAAEIACAHLASAIHLRARRKLNLQFWRLKPQSNPRLPTWSAMMRYCCSRISTHGMRFVACWGRCFDAKRWDGEAEPL